MKRLNKPIVIIDILFFVFGFVTWLGSVLIPCYACIGWYATSGYKKGLR